MNGDVEEILSRELREVASNLPIPVRPPMPQESALGQRLWRPLLVAATVLLTAGGAVALVASPWDDGNPWPADSPTASPTQPSPSETPSMQSPSESPTEKPPARPLTADAPRVPYVFGERLYVDGEQVPGSWWTVKQAGGAWAAQRTDDGWWWGTGTGQEAISGTVILQPQLSPNGRLLAVGTTTPGGGQVLLIDTQSGETLNTLPMDATGPNDPDALGVVTVTNDSKVFLRRDGGQLMWLAAEGGKTVDLDITAPNQAVEGSISAGLIVYDGTKDGETDAAYLAEVSDSGTLQRLWTLPSAQAEVNPSGTWLAYGGSWGGESKTIPWITAQAIDGGPKLKLQPPDDRPLATLTWEDDDLLLAELHASGGPTGLARCSIRAKDCVVIDLP